MSSSVGGPSIVGGWGPGPLSPKSSPGQQYGPKIQAQYFNAFIFKCMHHVVSALLFS